MHIIIGEETKFSIRIGRPIFYGFVLYIEVYIKNSSVF